MEKIITKTTWVWGRRIISCVLVLIMLCSQQGVLDFARAHAQTVSASIHQTPLLNLSPAHYPVQLVGLKVDEHNPFRFEFLIDGGDEVYDTAYVSKYAQPLLEYFLASVTVPKQDMWVNLSPHEPDRIIAPQFALTRMGRSLLTQDYILKQLAASLTHPDNTIGQEFWNKIFAQAFERYGTTEIPMDMFHKVWIVPDTATINEQEGRVILKDAQLKVMLERDYVIEKNIIRTLMRMVITSQCHIVIIRKICPLLMTL